MLSNLNTINLSEDEKDIIRKSRTSGMWMCIKSESLVSKSNDIILYKKNEIIKYNTK